MSPGRRAVLAVFATLARVRNTKTLLPGLLDILRPALIAAGVRDPTFRFVIGEALTWESSTNQGERPR